MAYCSLEDLKKYLPSQVIEELTDDDGLGEIQEEIVDQAIADAQVIIDGYCRGRYPDTMTDADVPAMITGIAVKMTAYNLYSRRLDLTKPETITKDYQFSLSTLTKIQAGKINPWPVASNPTVFITNKDDDDRVFTPTVWESYYNGIN